jgi:choline dehydrogenase
MRAVVTGIRLARAIAEQPALKPYVAEEITPGPGVSSDQDMAAFVRQTGISNHHPSSTGPTGTGTNSVVDPRLCVHGIDGLRLADASIMPSVSGRNCRLKRIRTDVWRFTTLGSMACFEGGRRMAVSMNPA